MKDDPDEHGEDGVDEHDDRNEAEIREEVERLRGEDHRRTGDRADDERDDLERESKGDGNTA
jgi:hypothetical protein